MGGRKPYPTNRIVRAITRAVRDAGGTVTVTARGHLRVTGPKGIAIIAHRGNSWRVLKDATTDLRTYAGLDVTIKT